MTLWVSIFVASLALLIVAARLFTGAAESLGRRLGMSAFATGVVIVSIGTSLPELLASIVAVRQGASGVVPGNVLGSSLSNLLFVLGMSTVFAPRSIRLGDQYIAIDLNFLLGAAFIIAVVLHDGSVSAMEGILGLFAYCVYLLYLLRAGSPPVGDTPPPAFGLRGAATLAASGVLIYLGARYTVESLTHIAAGLGVSPAIASVTLLSFGTTLPEMVVSAAAARQGKGEVAIGNILGSCIFNALAIPGLASLFGPVSVPAEVVAFPLPFYGGAVLLFYLLTQDKLISRWEGILFLILYGLFVAHLAGLR